MLQTHLCLFFYDLYQFGQRYCQKWKFDFFFKNLIGRFNLTWSNQHLCNRKCFYLTSWAFECMSLCVCELECVPSSLLMSALSGLSALFLPHTSWAAGERERGGGEGLWHAYAHIVDFMFVSVQVEILSSVNDQLFFKFLNMQLVVLQRDTVKRASLSIYSLKCF